MEPLAGQVGGTHYKGGMQPLEFFNLNPQLDWQQSNIIKYAYRHKDKNGMMDLLKVIHYALIEAQLHYPERLDELKALIKELV
ncbi:hypothetical protein CTA21_16530 [Salmonella enterica]|nr:hypothetical protein [Salmonella enterica]